MIVRIAGTLLIRAPMNVAPLKAPIAPDIPGIPDIPVLVTMPNIFDIELSAPAPDTKPIMTVTAIQMIRIR